MCSDRTAILAYPCNPVLQDNTTVSALVRLGTEIPGPAFFVADCSPLRAAVVLAGRQFMTTGIAHICRRPCDDTS
jgi:hypothetical protein